MSIFLVSEKATPKLVRLLETSELAVRCISFSAGEISFVLVHKCHL